MDYPVTLERDDNDTILVSFVDFPEAHTFGDSVDDALARAQGALATAIDAYIKDRRDIPLPSAVVARHRVAVPALIEAKIRLYETMRRQKVTKSELARKLDVHLPQVDRLFDVTHGSKFDQLEAAFGALGKRLVVGVEDLDQKRMAATTPAKRNARLGGRPQKQYLATRRSPPRRKR